MAIEKRVHMALRVLTWNMNLMGGERHGKKKAAALGSLEWDVAFLQEVTVSQWETISQSEWFHEGACGFDLVAAPDWKIPNAAAVVVRTPLTLSDVALIPGLPQPERGLSATIDFDGVKIAVCSWHAPNAAQSGAELKRDAYQCIIEWLDRIGTSLVILGFDSNWWARNLSLEPVVVPTPPKAPAHALSNEFFGPTPPHRLRDPLLDVLKADPKRYAEICALRPNGPLGISYRRGRHHDLDDRFDYIFVSPEIAASDVRYEYELGRASGSDHGVVFADLTIK